MIRICFYSRNGQTVGFAIRGHADYANYGEDIVCAAVSVLAQNTANSMEKLLGITTEGHWFQDERGDIYGIRPEEFSNNLREQMDLLLSSFKIGICSIQDAYPEHILILTREV